LGVAAEQPRFGVQPGPLRVVLNLDLGAELQHQSIKRPALGRAHVRGRDDSHRLVALAEPLQLEVKHAQAMPFHERAQQFHLIRGFQFGADLSAK
jgi:hypothetical protein